MSKLVVYVEHLAQPVCAVVRLSVGSFEREDITDRDGRVELETPRTAEYGSLVIVPEGGYWTYLVAIKLDGSAAQQVKRVGLVPLPVEERFWWHDALDGGIEHNGGVQVRIGVIDSGVSAHPALTHVQRIGCYINNQFELDTTDELGHGSNVTGLIAARPSDGGPIGVARHAEVLAVKVATRARMPRANILHLDIAQAIRKLSAEGCDLINISLGADPRDAEVAGMVSSGLVVDAIENAADRGVLCVAAAGNDSEYVAFPALLPTVIGVAAIGKSDWGAEMSRTRLMALQPGVVQASDEFFVPEFSARGLGVDAVAPGVGVISTAVPLEGWHQVPYQVGEGTSFAAPLACAALAVALSEEPEYLALPRDRSRHDKARAIFEGLCEDVGLAKAEFGLGMPKCPISTSSS